MSERIVVDPITRIEGHLRIEAQMDGDRIAQAYSSGTMVRGIEIILRGRDHRDAVTAGGRVLGELDGDQLGAAQVERNQDLDDVHGGLTGSVDQAVDGAAIGADGGAGFLDRQVDPRMHVPDLVLGTRTGERQIVFRDGDYLLLLLGCGHRVPLAV